MMKGITAKKVSYLVCSTVLALVLIYSCDRKIGLVPVAPTPVPVNTCDSVKYSVEIKPILDAQCATSGCHSGSFPAGGVDLATYANAKVQALNGRIKARAIDNGGGMPAAGQIPQSQKDLLKCWINNGALQ